MKYFVTGASGLIGQKVVSEILRRDEQARVMVLIHKNDLQLKISDQSRVVKIYGDIAYFDDSLGKKLKDFAPDMIIHLAAMNFIPDCVADPRKTMLVNVIGLKKLLRWVAICNCSLLFASTAGLYCSGDEVKNENSEIQVTNVYLKSKLEGEQAVVKLGKNNVVILRLSNVYGNDAGQMHLVKKLSVAWKDSVREVKLGNLSTIRDYIYVDDVVEAILRIVKKKISGYEVYNISYGDSLSGHQVVEMAKRLLGKFVVKIDHDLFRRNDKQKLYIGSEKFRNDFAWEPEVSLEEYFDLLRKESNE